MTGSELDWPSVERLANAVAPRQLSTGVQHGVLGEKISEGIMIVEVDSARLSDRKHFAGAFDRLIVRHGAFLQQGCHPQVEGTIIVPVRRWGF
jgi:hypothetical protein